MYMYNYFKFIGDREGEKAGKGCGLVIYFTKEKKANFSKQIGFLFDFCNKDIQKRSSKANITNIKIFLRKSLALFDM